MVAIKDRELPEGCQRCRFIRKHIFGNGLDYSYSCMLGAKQFPMPWIRQMEERASDCPLVEIVTCEKCLQWGINKEHPDVDGGRYCSTHRTYTGCDYFCGDAERREEIEK